MFQISGRSLSDWEKFIDEGMMAARNRGTDDPWSLGDFAVRLHRQPTDPRNVQSASRWLEMINDIDLVKKYIG